MLITLDIHIRFSFSIFKKNKLVNEMAFMDVLITANCFFFKFFDISVGDCLIAHFSASTSNQQNQNCN